MGIALQLKDGFVFFRKCDGTSSSKGGEGIETQLYPPRPIVEECVFAGLGKCGSGGWWLVVGGGGGL